MNKIYKIALAGCGHRGHSMIKIANSFADVEIVAICDNQPEKGYPIQKIKNDFPEAKFYLNHTDMLDKEKPDILLIETPAPLHTELALEALERDINVLSDIPCVQSVEEANELWQAQHQTKALYMTGANPNMWAFIRHAQLLYRKGLLGDIVHAECEYIHDIRDLWKETPWRKYYESIKYCTHSLGPILSVIKEDLRYVSCFDSGSHMNKEKGQHDWMSAMFKTASNIVVNFLVSFINEYPQNCHNYRLRGTKGSWERSSDYGNGQQCYFYSKELHEEKRFYPTSSEMIRSEFQNNSQAGGHGGADYAIWFSFLEALRQGKDKAPIDLREGLQMTLPGIYAAESARRGGELMEIKYPWDA